MADRLGGPVQLLAALTWSSDVGIEDRETTGLRWVSLDAWCLWVYLITG